MNLRVAQVGEGSDVLETVVIEFGAVSFEGVHGVFQASEVRWEFRSDNLEEVSSLGGLADGSLDVREDLVEVGHGLKFSLVGSEGFVGWVGEVLGFQAGDSAHS